MVYCVGFWSDRLGSTIGYIAEVLGEKQKAQVNDNDAKATAATYDEAIQKLTQVQQEIVNLYLKIKRCSKDVNITESQYLKHVETTEDREERQLIAKMDPMIVLQYINVSIDVIINLKFEDIENKMVETARNKEIVSARGEPASKDDDGDSDDEDKLGQVQADKKKMAAAESDYVDDDNTQKDLEISNQLDELVVEDTPQQIRDKVQKIGGKPD